MIDLKERARAAPLVPSTADWDSHQSVIRHRLIFDDADHFLRWPTIVGTMLPGDQPMIRRELEILQAHRDWRLWELAITEGGIGDPPLIDGWTSGALIHQTHALSLALDKIGREAGDFDSVLEIGGGYGAMRSILWRIGFTGDYTIYDLPVMSVLQRWYIEHHYLPGETIYLSPPDATLPAQVDLYIALWSLAEIPLSQREPLVNTSARAFVIAYYEEYLGMDNLTYFAEFAAARPNHRWTNIPLGYIDNALGGNYLLIGSSYDVP